MTRNRVLLAQIVIAPNKAAAGDGGQQQPSTGARRA
jgi:hypothetical protein